MSPATSNLYIRLFLFILIFPPVVAQGQSSVTLDDLKGSYSDAYGKKLAVFSVDESNWKARVKIPTLTTRGDYFCGFEGVVTLSGGIMQVKTENCTVNILVTPEKLKVQNAFDDKGGETNCSCGSAASWFGEFLRSEKQNKIIDFELGSLLRPTPGHLPILWLRTS